MTLSRERAQHAHLHDYASFCLQLPLRKPFTRCLTCILSKCTLALTRVYQLALHALGDHLTGKRALMLGVYVILMNLQVEWRSSDHWHIVNRQHDNRCVLVKSQLKTSLWWTGPMIQVIP